MRTCVIEYHYWLTDWLYKLYTPLKLRFYPGKEGSSIKQICNKFFYAILGLGSKDKTVNRWYPCLCKVYTVRGGGCWISTKRNNWSVFCYCLLLLWRLLLHFISLYCNFSYSFFFFPTPAIQCRWFIFRETSKSQMRKSETRKTQ